MRTKFQNVLLTSLCAIILFSCSSDDEVSNASLVGTWKLTSLVIESAFDFNGDGTASRDLFLETDCYDGDFIENMEDGNVRIVSGLTFISVDDNFQPTHRCLNGFDRTTTWTQTGNTVTIENGSADIVGTISGNTVTATIVKGFEMEKYNGTSVVDDKESMTLTYEKQ
ncbi:lipocalin family protein [Algibacter sp. 2305UL17-15]|uniref:lipocalin family protein n=1 Tax=Algibacter sp. 2305UL17-15 TaxID=3231268 RepID=UPI003458B0F4